MALADIKGKYYFNLSITEEVWKSMSSDSKKNVVFSILKKVLELEKTNALFWADFNIAQQTKIVSLVFRGSGYNGMSAVDILDSTGKKYENFFLFGTSNYTSGYKAYGVGYCQTGFSSQWSGTIPYEFITPSIPVVIPDPVINTKITTYLQFMQKSSLYNSLITGVQSTLLRKPTVKSLSDYILNIMKNFTDGMVIFDYYQWQGETINGMTELRMYKNFYLRIFGKVGSQLVSKSIQLDHHLFSDIAGATLLDNGIMIAGNGITDDKKNTYTRLGYMIHGNNCDLQSLIDKIQEDNNFSLLPIEFADLDSISEKLAENKDFLTKDGKSAQDRYNEYYNNAFSKYSQLKSVLGLTDEQVVSMSKQEAERLMQNYINTYNNTAQLELATQNAQIEKQNAQQAQAESSAKQQEKVEAAAEKAKQQALQAAKDKQTNETYIKKAYQSRVSAIMKINQFTGSALPVPSYADFVSNFNNLGTCQNWSFNEVGSMSVPVAKNSENGKYYNGYKWNYKLTLKDSDKNGVIDSMSIDPLVISIRYCDDTGANVLGDNILHSDDDNLKTGSSVNTNENLCNITTTQNSNAENGAYAALVAGMYELGGIITKPVSAFLTSYEKVGATEHQDMQDFVNSNNEIAGLIKSKNDNDKLIPQYLEKLSNKNMSPYVNIEGLSIDLTPLNDKLEEIKVVHQTHYDEYKVRETERVDREKIAFDDLHSDVITDIVTLKGVSGSDGNNKVLELPQGHYKALKKVGYYEKQAEQLYDIESDNIAGNEMSAVTPSGVDMSIDSSVELKHITGTEYEDAKEFGEWEYVAKVAENYQNTVQLWINNSFKDRKDILTE